MYPCHTFVLSSVSLSDTLWCERKLSRQTESRRRRKTQTLRFPEKAASCNATSGHASSLFSASTVKEWKKNTPSSPAVGASEQEVNSESSQEKWKRKRELIPEPWPDKEDFFHLMRRRSLMKEAADAFRWTDCGYKLVGAPPLKYLFVFLFCCKKYFSCCESCQLFSSALVKHWTVVTDLIACQAFLIFCTRGLRKVSLLQKWQNLRENLFYYLSLNKVFDDLK